MIKIGLVGGWGFINLEDKWDLFYTVVNEEIDREIDSWGDRKAGVELLFDQSSYSFHFLSKYGEKLKSKFKGIKFTLCKYEDDSYLSPFLDLELLPIFMEAQKKNLVKGSFAYVTKFPKFSFFSDLIGMDSLFDEVIHVEKEGWFSDVFREAEECSIFTYIKKQSSFNILVSTLSSTYTEVWKTKLFYYSGYKKLFLSRPSMVKLYGYKKDGEITLEVNYSRL